MADLPARPPRTRGDCADGPRPCPYAHACRYGLALPPGMDSVSNCALDHAEAEGGMTLEEVGELLGVTRERVRQIEKRALSRLREGTAGEFLAEVLGVEPKPVAEVAPARPRRRKGRTAEPDGRDVIESSSRPPRRSRRRRARAA